MIPIFMVDSEQVRIGAVELFAAFRANKPVNL